MKKINKKNILQISKKIKPITKKYNVKFIINDNVMLAKLADADGCHIGQLDGSMNEVKKHLKNKIFGVTCHNSRKLAKIAIKNKATYVAFGSFYKSKLKPLAKKANLNILKWASGPPLPTHDFRRNLKWVNNGHDDPVIYNKP